MSERSGPPSEEGSGDDIRPYGDDRDSSEESSEEDPEEARKIADGFIVDGDDDEEGGGESSTRPDAPEDPEERRRRRKEKKRKRRREREERARQRERDNELSEDELELLNENRELAGPSRKPLKRLRRRSGSEEGGAGANLKDMFADDAERGFVDEDEDDLGDFIEEDDEEEADRGETEEQRRARKREEKLKRREAGKLRPDVSGVDRQSMDEIHAVFGNEDEYAWALDLEGGDTFQEEERERKDIRLEDVFDPSEIKERRLQDEDKTIVSVDRPERHQLVNSTLSENPVYTPETLYPPPELAARWAYNKISPRTRYLFCGLDEENSYIPPGHDYNQSVYRRTDLMNPYIESVSAALNMMFVQHLEVPYLWHYKRDVFSVLENQGRSAVQFLERDDLWSLYHLGIKYRAIFGRLEQMRESWAKIKERHDGISDEYLTETLLPNVCAMSVEAAADGYEWLNYHYASDMGFIKQFEAIDEGVKRLPEKALADDLRTGPILKLVEAFGVSVPQIARYFSDPNSEPATVVNPEKTPLELADEFAGPSTQFLLPEEALGAAARILTTDFAKDPSLRQQARDWMSELGQVSVTPTERGMTVIDKYHFYYTFKFLTDKPIGMFRDSPQFLHILKAEEEGLVEISIKVDDRTAEEGFILPLTTCCRSNDYGELSTAWNEQRKKICEDVVKKHLIPSTARWAKDYLRGLAEDYVAERCRMELEFRVNVRPFATPAMEQGETPSVLALTNGKGEARDAVVAVMLDEEGGIRTQSKFDNLRPGVDCESFKELVQRSKPRVIVVGGLSVNAGKMRDEAAEALRQVAISISQEQPPASDAYPDPEYFRQALAEFDIRMQEFIPPLIFVSDATARMYMHSEEAEREYPSLPPNGRYALALARYTQNPLNAYCKLGRKISEVTFMEHHQKLISQEKLLVHLERGLVNAVCFMGIEINSCVADAYQRTMLPFIAGLGPRKANALVNGVQRLGALTNRMQFSDTVLVGPTIFENLAGFLSIEHDLKDLMLEEANPQEQPDPLDMTRIHPEDYEFAQKMCQDAMDLDVEDVEGQHKSDVVLKLMLDEDRPRKLAELNLEDFAYNLQQQGEGSKRHTLSQIVSELISYRADRRPAFYVPNEWEIVTMLTGETERTIGRGMGVTATVRRALASRAFCSLESGIDAVLEREYVLDDTMPPINSCEDVLKARQSVKAIVLEAQPARFQVKISMRPSDVSQAVIFQQPFREDPFNDVQRQMDAEEAAAHRRRRQAGAVKRQINHPNWHAVNSGQAQQYLHSGQRGDVVIRPSSKGADHLAVTWKVDEDIYQHIDVQEIDKPNEYALGRILRVAGKYSYSDLDELIINHVKALARMVEMLMASEKYKPEEELDQFLKNYVQAHPGRSMYGFTLDTDRPGHFQLRFLNRSTKDGGVIRTWPVKVLPGAYQLNDAVVGGVMELSNAFKMQYSNLLSEQGSGGKTPGVRVGKTPLGGRTPGGGRTPAIGGMGGRTPADPRMAAAYGRTPVRPGMTPNPYNAPPQAAYGGAPYGAPPQNGVAYGAPPNGAGGYGGPQSGGAPGIGMNPERAAMIARQGGR